tara:strand:- start:474 stop:1556 length:1083 start_codon:yes stop_codon:yes gene_type:complete
LKKYYPLIILFIFSCGEIKEESDCAGIIGGNSICGCTDNSALNYLPDATFDDGSCEFEIDTSNVDTTYGCTDSTAANYDSTAVLSDDSCAYSIQKLVWETYGSSESEFEIFRDGFQFVISVAKFAGDSLNVIGYVDQWEQGIYVILDGIFTGLFDLKDYSYSSDVPSGFWTTLTLVYETGWSQSYDSGYPDYPISEVYDYVASHVFEWCHEHYYSVDGDCYHAGDISILQELVGNFAPSVLVTMEEPEWENGRLIHFHCQGCILETTLPESIGNLTELREFFISNTLLTGEIPESMFDLENLELMILNNNQLSGTIPETICNLDIENMIFELDNNQFCPQYPECIEEIIGNQDTSQCEGG